MWPPDQAWRAPVGDFPPPWASAWGDDPFGLWADLTVNGVTQRMRWIEPSGPEGFWMGSTEAEIMFIASKSLASWAKKVEMAKSVGLVNRGYWLADTPCTQEFWSAVDGSSLSHFVQGVEAALRPEEQVNVVDVQRFLGKLVRYDSALVRARLPTEVEWEYAARGGSDDPYWWGFHFDPHKSNVNAINDRDWSQKKPGTTPVKAFDPNRWGLHDMLGNVWEWTADQWIEQLGAEGSVPDINSFAIRGGSWIDRPGDARCASRNYRNRMVRKRDLGFRFLIDLPKTSSA